MACGDCVEACPQSACTLTSDGIVTNPDLCLLCGKCADVCPTRATEMSGELLSVDQVMTEIRKERVLMDQSGGGVTFSGGEPLMHPELLIPLLDACGSEGIHRCVDTSGFANPELLLEVASKTDLFLYDLKLMDREQHLKHTGVSNDQILDNLRLLSETGADINIRIPLITGINDDDENIKKTSSFIASLAGVPKKIHLLPYHPSATHKHEKLGQSEAVRAIAPLTEPGDEKLNHIIKLFKSDRLIASVGG